MKPDLYTATAFVLHTDRETAQMWVAAYVYGANSQQLAHILQEGELRTFKSQLR